jgi:4-hydroxy-4-methyl-2-oxoglutarate aldolase
MDYGECRSSQRDLLVTSTLARGATGLILDVGCRDVATLRGMKFPVWSKAIISRWTVKAALGNVNTPIVCAGLLINPGDVVVADDDGVAVVPYTDVSLVLKAGEQREQGEDEKRKRLAAGELGLDIYKMRQTLTERGLRYFDSPEKHQIADCE